MRKSRMPRPAQPYDQSIVERANRELEASFSEDNAGSNRSRSISDKYFRKISKPSAEALALCFDGLCAYCGENQADDIDHFRPKGGASNLDGSGDRNHYFWLAWEWRNLYPCCYECNRAKRSFFPVEGPRSRLLAPYEEIINSETSLLLDPFVDDPDEHLLFEVDGSALAKSYRGEVSIKVFGLNRRSLIDIRYRRNLQAADLLQKLRESGVAAADEESFFVGGQTSYATAKLIHQELAGNEPIAMGRSAKLAFEALIQSSEEIISKEDGEDYRLLARPVRRISVRNFKLLESLDVELPEPRLSQGSWLVLLGENASGKSTLLQAAAMALAGSDEASRLTSSKNVLRRGARSGRVDIWFWDNDIPATLTFSSEAKEFGGTKGPSAITLAYGALRHMERGFRRGKRSGPHFARISPMVEPIAKIPNPNRWLCSIDEGQFDVAASALRDILALRDEETVYRRDGQVYLQLGSGSARLIELSAGYQMVVGISVDIMRLLLERWQTLNNAAGTVLIDEIDAHLHPRWKMRIVRALRNAFPSLQFLATTHDPLVLRGTFNGEVGVMRRDESGTVSLRMDLPPIEGMRVDAILTSPHFGLESTLDPEVEALLAELYHLRSVARTSEVEERLEEIMAVVGDRSLDVLGSSAREQMVIEATTELTADLQSVASGADVEGSRQVAKDRIKGLILRKFYGTSGAE